MGGNGVIDKVQIIYDFLTKPGTELAASVGSRVWSPIAPKSWNNETNAIVFHQSAGTSHFSAATQTATFEFKCFGGSGSFGPERTLFGLLHDRLMGSKETVMGGDIIAASMVSENQRIVEPDTNFKSHIGTFQLTFLGE